MYGDRPSQRWILGGLQAPRGSAGKAVGHVRAGSRNRLVLAFSDDSTAGDLDYFCRGLRGEIIHTLAPIKKLRVVASDVKPGNVPGLIRTSRRP